MYIYHKKQKIEVKERIECWDTAIYKTESGIYYHSQDKYHSIRKLCLGECIVFSVWGDIEDKEYSIIDAYIIDSEEVGKIGLLARPCNNSTWFETPKIEIKFIVGEKGNTWHAKCKIIEILNEV